MLDIMMSFSTWDIGAFLNIFWTTTDLVTKLGQLIDINKSNNFQESFQQFGGLELSSRFFSIYPYSNYSITNDVKIPVFHFFWKSD